MQECRDVSAAPTWKGLEDDPLWAVNTSLTAEDGQGFKSGRGSVSNSDLAEGSAASWRVLATAGAEREAVSVVGLSGVIKLVDPAAEAPPMALAGKGSSGADICQSFSGSNGSWALRP